MLLRAFLFFALSIPAFANPSLPYADQDFPCTESSLAERYLRDFNIDIASFGGRELCRAEVDTKKLLNDLAIIENTKFEAAGEHSFIRGYVARDRYYSWLKQETRGMERGNDVPYATAYNSGGYFTMQDGWAKLSTLGRVGTVIHEARHTAGYRHYPCTFGPYANSSTAGCDTSYAQGGSHGVEMEYYARVVLEAKNLHPVYQSMARLMALGRSNFVFNQQPMRKREGIALHSDTEAYLFADGALSVREIPAGTSANMQLKRTSFGASFVEGMKSLALDFYRSGLTGVGLDDDYSYYKLFQIARPNAPQSIADTEEVDVGNSRFFAVVSKEGKISSYNFPRGEWFPALNAAGKGVQFVTTAPNGQQGLFLVAQDGTITPVEIANRRLGAPLAVKWTSDTISYAKLDGQLLLRLRSDGAVVGAGSGEQVPELAHIRAKNMLNIPLYDAFQVQH